MHIQIQMDECWTKSRHKIVNLNSPNSEANYFYSFVLVFFFSAKEMASIYPVPAPFPPSLFPVIPAVISGQWPWHRVSCRSLTDLPVISHSGRTTATAQWHFDESSYFSQQVIIQAEENAFLKTNHIFSLPERSHLFGFFSLI